MLCRCSVSRRVVFLSQTPTLPPPVVDISLEPLRVKREDGDRFYSSRQVANEYNVQEQLSSHLARTQTSPNQADGPPNTLIKAELPCSSARGTNLSDKYRVLKTVKGRLTFLSRRSRVQALETASGRNAR
ncbi:eukaryotic translation initiation factor-like [Capsicum annuum]|uniref:eukaryotic translation initiation factor-like n=1 Tax=Capsicum annuum TaxID=4072 RepID=UPI001FB089DC|nr:eukaryotic translation initiation factor-like [Capsicum annuum]